MAKLIPLEHPGVILREEFIEPLELTVYKVSKATGIPQTALGQIIRGQRSISTSNALKLSKFFGLSDEYFAKLQMQYELELKKREENKKLKKIIPFAPKKIRPRGKEELFEA